MPVVTITRLATGATASSYAGAHPKAILKTRDHQLVLPFAPRGGSLGGWARRLDRVDRPGRRPLVLDTGPNVTSLDHEYLIAALDHQVSVESVLNALRKIADDNNRVTLVNLSPLERGPWRIESVNVTSELRQHGTNAITRATVAVSYVEASDVVRLGPLTGGKRSGKGIKKPTTHVFRKGDTLRKLAAKYYGEPDEWRRIAKANGIKDPKKIKTGRKLRIPADDKKD